MIGRTNSVLDAVFFGYMPRFARRAARFLQRNIGKILYYALVIAVLAAIAYAAEIYRRDAGAPAASQPEAQQVSTVQEEPAEALRPLMENMPEDAQVLRAYCDTPQWNDSLGQWEAHTGVDFAVKDVYSLTGGVVAACGTDPLYGGYVEIDAGKFQILYASIQLDPSIQPGGEVLAGDRMGTANSSMSGEDYEGSHLHMEIMQDEAKQNPQTFEAEIHLMD